MSKTTYMTEEDGKVIVREVIETMTGSKSESIINEDDVTDEKLLDLISKFKANKPK